MTPLVIATLVAILIPVALVLWLVGYTAIDARRAERRAPRDGRFVEIAGARIHYIDQGSGPTMLLVHGLGGQLRNFTYGLTERLVADHRVIAIDRPGSGYSTRPRGPQPDLDGQATIVAETIRALKLDRPVLVGHSLGGAIALAVALDHPDLIGGLALIAPLTQPLEDELPAAFRAMLLPSPLVRRCIAWTLATPLGRRNQTAGLTLIFGPEAVPVDYDTSGGGALTLRPGNFFAASSEVSLGSGELIATAARYGDLRMPIAILFGRDDRILDPALHGGRLATAAADATLEMIEGGHMIPLTRPAECAAWLRRYMQRLADADADRPWSRS